MTNVMKMLIILTVLISLPLSFLVLCVECRVCFLEICSKVILFLSGHEGLFNILEESWNSLLIWYNVTSYPSLSMVSIYHRVAPGESVTWFNLWYCLDSATSLGQGSIFRVNLNLNIRWYEQSVSMKGWLMVILNDGLSIIFLLLTEELLL